MARPVKTGLDYFPLHIDFFDDIRICALAVQYGTKGQLAAIILLVHLYKTGYYLPWDDATRVSILKDMPGVTFDELDRIVEELVKWDFFDKALFNQQGVLTSREVQKHFFNATKRRRNNIAQMPFLLAETNNSPEDCSIQPGVGHKNGNVGQQRAETGFSPTEMAFQQAVSTQEYNKRDKIIKNYPFSSSTSSSACMKGISIAENAVDANNNAEDDVGAADGAASGLVPARNQGDVYTEVEQLKSNSQWVEVMCMQRQLTPLTLHQKLDEFARECICRGKTGHNDLADAQGHFCNWLSINIKQTNTNSQIQPYETIRKHKTADDHVADAQRWAYEETLRFLQSGGEGRGNDVPKGLPF